MSTVSHRRSSQQRDESGPVRSKQRAARKDLGWLVMASLFAAILAVTVGACGGSSSTSSGAADVSSAGGGDSGKQVNIAMFLVSTANTHQQAALKGAERVVEEDGNATIHPFNGNFDPASQSKQIEDATATGQYNAFLADSIDGTQTVPAITKALNEGVTVVCSFEVCGSEPTKFEKQLPVAAQVSPNLALIGENAAKVVGAQACKGIDPCNVAFLKGVSVLAAVKAIAVPFEEDLAKEYPNVKIVAKPEGKFEANAANEAMKPVIQANPDLNVVFAVGDQEAAGAAQAIEESSLKGKGVKIIGDGASELAKREIEAGKWFASAILRPMHEGEEEAKYVIAATRGEPLSPDLVDTGLAPGFPEGFIFKGNASKWRPEWAG